MSTVLRRGRMILAVIATSLVFATAGLAQMPGSTTAQDKTAKDPKREADRRALDKLSEDMTRAFDTQDAATIAAHFTEEGECIGNDGEPICGRAAIEKAYAEFFKTLKGRPRVEIQSEVLRFPSADVAVHEATLRLKNVDGESVMSGRQNTVLVREGGEWKVAIVRAWAPGLGQN